MPTKRSLTSAALKLVLILALAALCACLNTRSFSNTKRSKFVQTSALPTDLFLAGVKGKYRRIKPLRARELNEPVETPVRKLTNAKVVLADYSLLVQDFPAVRKIASTGDDPSEMRRNIDAWIVENFAYIAETQVTVVPDEVIQSPIPAESKTRAL